MRTITRGPCRRRPSAAPASRWRPGCCAWPRCRRSIPISAALAAFGRAARSGAASVMAHYVRPHGPMPLVEEAREVARAAADVGVRVTFAVSMRDRNPLVYGPSDAVLESMPPEARAHRRGAIPRPHAERRGTGRARRGDRRRGREPDLRRAIRPQRRAMVLGRTCCARSRRPRSEPAAASTCISWRRSISAPSPTPPIPRASFAISKKSGC